MVINNKDKEDDTYKKNVTTNNIKSNDDSNGKYRHVFLAIGIITGFIFMVTMTTFYVSDAIRNNNACGCVVPIPYMIIILSSLGIFVGSIAYYIMASDFKKEKQIISKGVEKTLNFLDHDERKIMKTIIKYKGEIKQSVLDEETGFTRVKIHRVLKKLEQRDAIKIIKRSRINIIKIDKQLEEVFVQI